MRVWLHGALLFFSCFAMWAQSSDIEKQIDKRNQDSNGIVVPDPKPYDDFLLQQMLNAAETRLAAMQVLETGPLSSRLGNIAGAQQTSNSFALNAQSAPLPAMSTVANGATGSTVNTTQSNGQTTTTTNQTTNGQPATNTTTNAPSFAPPSATAPAPTTSLPSSFGVSSSDVLNEQMQLTYEIANLRLLLEGAMSDRFTKGGKSVKPRTTLGFSVTLSPRYKDAVAMVEVEITNNSAGQEQEPPAITALLPREKTYNVASIRESNVAVGAGAVTQVFGVSGSFLHGSKSYYLVQDQDTVALQLEVPSAEQSNKTAFLWEFRPVLGQHYVSAGMKQTFVQLAFSNPPLLKSPGDVSVTTYWRHYDAAKGLVGRIIPGSLRQQKVVSIPTYDIEESQKPTEFSNADLEDLGNGQMLVKLHGNFLSDTVVRIGSKVLANGPGGIALTQIGMEFTAPISDLATRDVVLVCRDGSEIPLRIPHDLRPNEPLPPPSISSVQISAVDENKSLISVRFKDDIYLREKPPFVFVLGDKVFGYSDAPFFPSGDGSLTAIVPTALLVANPTLIVKPLFAPARFSTQIALNVTPFGQTERVVLLEKAEDHSSFLLYGSRLSDAQVISPENVTLKQTPDVNTLRQFDLTAPQLKGAKQIFIRRGAERPILVPLPGNDAEGSSSKQQQQVSISGTVDVKTDSAPPDGKHASNQPAKGKPVAQKPRPKKSDDAQHN